MTDTPIAPPDHTDLAPHDVAPHDEASADVAPMEVTDESPVETPREIAAEAPMEPVAEPAADASLEAPVEAPVEASGEPVVEPAAEAEQVTTAEAEPAAGDPAGSDEPTAAHLAVDDAASDATSADAAPAEIPSAEIPIIAAPPPEPVRPVFRDLHLSDEILRAIDDMGYRHPTPIQEQAIPVVLMGRDVLGTAQTGTGKTASFTLPMMDILSGSRSRARMPRSLILEPTRELALQVAENFQQYGKYMKLTHALIIGGESMSDQKDILNKGVDVLIATPGRLLDMFDRGTILLSDAKLLVIDEADRMLDMGFIPDVERIVSLLPANRQTLFFSATMSPEIKRLADAFLQNPKQIAVSRPASVATTITEGLALVAEHDKREALRRLVRNEQVQNALIFCNRKKDVDILYKSLSKHRFSAGALHGDMAQTVRFSTLEKFKAGELRLLVCSDVAARGLDIGGLSHVFNFDVPIHAEDYVHRIGRTGRAGLEGKAFTIAQPEDRFHVEQIEKLIGHPIPPIVVEGLDPVDWAEKGAKRRRGKPEAKKPAAKTPEAKKPEAKAPERKTRPDKRRTREETVEIVEEAPREAPRRVEERRREEPKHVEERRREEPRQADDRRRDEPRRDDRRRDEHRRDEPRRDDRRERYRRDDDLGPSVLGFGDDIPAFMFLRSRTSRAAAPVEAEA